MIKVYVINPNTPQVDAVLAVLVLEGFSYEVIVDEDYVLKQAKGRVNPDDGVVVLFPTDEFVVGFWNFIEYLRLTGTVRL